MPSHAEQRAKEIYEFGPFRADPEKEVLLRDSEPVPLTPKTFQTLMVLVRHSKEIVSKDDLMKMVWPDTFVEEANLSRNIFMLRKALGESPQDHRYIVTVPGRGYRFAEDVHLVPETPENKVDVLVASRSRVQVQVEQSGGRCWIAAVLIALAASAGILLGLIVRRPPVLSEKDTVVLAEFANSTGDPVFDGALRLGLAVQLRQSPYLSLVPEDRVQQTLRLMGQPSDAHLNSATAREICERIGSTVVLEGSIETLGNQYVLGLNAKNCANGNVLYQDQVQLAKKEDVLQSLGEMAGKFRARAGESTDSITQHQKPLAEVSTQSLEALKTYSKGWEVAFSAGYADAVPFFERAVEIDPQFAMAYASLARMYGDIGEFALSAQTGRKAYELREHASDPEKFFIAANYERQVTGNLKKARENLELWTQIYPRDPLAHALLSGFTSQGSGNYERAIQEAGKAIELDPDTTPAYVNLAFSNFYLDRFDAASTVLQRAADRKLDIPDAVVLSYYISFLKGDSATMQHAVTSAKDKPGAEDWLRQSLVLARSGHLQAAGTMSRQAVDLALQAGQTERAATFLSGQAAWEALFGNIAAAKRCATSARKLSNGRDVEYVATFALALAGEESQVQILATDLERRFAEDTSVRYHYSPTLRALLVLKKDPRKAIEILQVAEPHDLAVPGVDFYFFFGGFYSTFVRGEAYLALHQGAEASAEFQKILARRGLLAADPLGALAHLQLARAYAMQGDIAKAKSAYQEFFTLLKDADSGIPVLRQAQTEYATFRL